MTTGHTVSTTSSLRQEEAISLAYALAGRAAELAGVRVLVIKGWVACGHGLRANRVLADVDILVEPSGFFVFTRQLEEWGWKVRLGDFSDLPSPQHSLTYVNERWPCDIDAHHQFPGFLAASQRVFEELWERRQLWTIAGAPVPVAGWSSSVAMMALHSVRSVAANPRHAEELRHLRDLSSDWTHEQRSDLALLAGATGCSQSLDGVWRELGVSADPDVPEVTSEAVAAWRERVEGRLTAPRVWLRYVRSSDRGSSVLSRVGTLVWPPEAMMRATRQISPGSLPLFRARVARIAGALVRAPRDLLAAARGGRNVERDAFK